ncbi:MAG TPA: hypothetical protein VGM27_10720 [Acidobacteriaceae bacterium]
MPLRIPRSIKTVAVALAITVAVVGAGYYYAITPHRPSSPRDSRESLLYQADRLACENRWEDALPLYGKARKLFLAHALGVQAYLCECLSLSQRPPPILPGVLDQSAEIVAAPGLTLLPALF